MKRLWAVALGIAALWAVGIGEAVAQSGPVYCNQTALYDASTNGATQVVAAPGGSASIYVCSYVVMAGAGATNVGLVYGTGTNCATNLTKITPAWPLAANGQVNEAGPVFSGVLIPAAKALCVNTSAGNAVTARVSYAILF